MGAGEGCSGYETEKGGMLSKSSAFDHAAGACLRLGASVDNLENGNAGG
jgi:hypothetical protein